MADLLKTGDAARHLGVTAQYLSNLRCSWGRGRGGCVSVPEGVRYTRIDLDAWKRAGVRIERARLTVRKALIAYNRASLDPEDVAACHQTATPTTYRVAASMPRRRRHSHPRRLQEPTTGTTLSPTRPRSRRTVRFTPDPISLATDPDPLTPAQRAAEWERYLIRHAWPFGLAADDLARAAKARGPSHVWWLGLLRAGELPGPQPMARADPETDDLEAGLDQRRRRAEEGASGHAIDIRFGQIIHRLCPGAERFRSWRPDGGRPWAYRLPPLDECRERFQRSTLAKSP